MKVLKRNMTTISEEVIYDELNEKEALALCNDLNTLNTNDNYYFIVMPNDYKENNFGGNYSD